MTADTPDPRIAELVRLTRRKSRTERELLDRLNLSPKAFAGLLEAARAAGAVVDLADDGSVMTERAPDSPGALLDLRRARASITKLKAERKQILDELHEAQARLEFVAHVEEDVDAPAIRRREKRSGQREACAVALFSDWHVEEIVEPEKVNGLNTYGLAIAEQRIEKWVHGIIHEIEGARSTFQIRDLILWLGGDLMTGHLHDDNIETTELPPVQTTLWLKRKLIQVIDALLEHAGLERLHVPCCFGNHGRTTHKPRSATAAEHSREWLLYHVLADHYAGEKRVTITAPRSLLVYQPVYDSTIRFLHGNMAGFRYNGGVGGLAIPLNKAVGRLNKGREADLTCLGHFHQLHLNIPRWVVNGSGIGYAPYALDVTAEYEPPQQAFFLWDSRHGPCRATPIWLQDGKTPETPEILSVEKQRWRPKTKIRRPGALKGAA